MNTTQNGSISKWTNLQILGKALLSSDSAIAGAIVRFSDNSSFFYMNTCVFQINKKIALKRNEGVCFGVRYMGV